MNPKFQDIMRAVRDERIRAYNSGRDEECESLVAMIQRLNAVQLLDPAHPTHKLVLEQALAILHRTWDENSP